MHIRIFLLVWWPTWPQSVCCPAAVGRTGKAAGPVKPRGFRDGTGRRWAAATPDSSTALTAPHRHLVTTHPSPSEASESVWSLSISKKLFSFLLFIIWCRNPATMLYSPPEAPAYAGAFPEGRAVAPGPSEGSPSESAAGGGALSPAGGAWTRWR